MTSAPYLTASLVKQNLGLILPIVADYLSRVKRLPVTLDELWSVYLSPEDKRALLERQGQSVPRPVSRCKVVHVIVPPVFRLDRPGDAIAMNNHIKVNGWAVIDVCRPAQVQTLLGGAWNYMEAVSPDLVSLTGIIPGIKANDPSTWTNFNWPSPVSVGVVMSNGAGQAPFMWQARCMEEVQAVFRTYYYPETISSSDKGLVEHKADNGSPSNKSAKPGLTVSFDRFGVFRGAEHNVSFNRSWLHIDENLCASDTERKLRPQGYLQGALNLIDCINPHDSGGFLFLPGGAADLKASFAAGKEGWIKPEMGHYCSFPEDHRYNSMPLATLSVRAGQMVVWESVLPHANYAPVTKKIQGQLRRLVCYISYTPRAGVPDAIRRARRVAASQGITTGHRVETTYPKGVISESHGWPRRKHLKPLGTPAMCYKTSFTPAEEALL